MRNRIHFVKIFVALLTLFPAALFAQAFRYQDESGNIHFVDRIDAIPERYKAQVVPPTPGPSLTPREYRMVQTLKERAEREQRMEELRRQGLIPDRKKVANKGAHLANSKRLIPSKDDSGTTEPQATPPPKKMEQVAIVQVFVSPSCKECPDLQRFLKQNGIKFKSYDIVTSQKAFELFDKLGTGTRLPVTKIGAKVIKGLDYQSILDAATNSAPKKPEKPLGTL